MFEPLRRFLRAIGPAQGPRSRLPGRVAVADPVALYEQAARQYEQGELDACARLLEQVISAKHDVAGAHFLLGEICRRRGDLDAAADCYTLASTFDPALSDAQLRLGVLFLDHGRLPDALAALQKAYDVAPANAALCNLLGSVLMKLQRPDEAAAFFHRAVAADPQSADAHSNLGYVLLRHFENVEDGSAHIEAALELDPEHHDALCNRVMALQYLGRLPEALALSETLLSRADDDQLRLNRSLMLLSLGDFAHGWDEYEARKRVGPGASRGVLTCPDWNGEPLSGKTIVVRAEQGLGDQIMFASCIPDVCDLAEHCIVESDPRLTPIFARSYPRAHCSPPREGPSDRLRQDVGPDFGVSIGSLPRFFRRDISAFPHHAGYLRADARRVARWRARLSKLSGRVKVGLSWEGGVRSSRRKLRSIPLEQWLPVLRVPGIDFVSLQYSDCSEAIARVAHIHGVDVRHWPDAIEDYDETAALVCALDLVISVQTAVVHLAGALGQRTWALIAAVPEWRYMADGEKMPWYPSVRLVRQQISGNWAPVLARVADELADFALTHR